MAHIHAEFFMALAEHGAGALKQFDFVHKGNPVPFCVNIPSIIDYPKDWTITRKPKTRKVEIELPEPVTNMAGWYLTISADHRATDAVYASEADRDAAFAAIVKALK